MSDQIFLSVLICTYNRGALLRESILSVIQQDLPSDQYELLVVDNNSKDNTRQMVLELVRENPQIRYLCEGNQGLSYARNRGWEEAKGEYVIYLDDDAKAQPGWLASAQKVALAHRPLFFGGPYYACYLEPKPEWFKDEYGSNVLGKIARPLAEGEYLTGGNLAVRRSLLECTGGFRTDLGMRGNKIAFGEETALQLLVREQHPGALIFYEPQMAIWHLVRTEKMNLAYLTRQANADGQYSFEIFSLPNFPRTFSLPAKARSLIRSSLRCFAIFVGYNYQISMGMFFRDRDKYPFKENFFYEKCIPIIRKLSWTLEDIRQIVRTKVG